MTPVSSPTESRVSRPPAGSATLPHVLVLGTGGTIAGSANGLSQAGYTSAVVPIDSLLDAVPQLAQLAHLSMDQIALVGGQDMNEAVWLTLAARVNAELASADVDGVVVTHGTDTIEETAFFLSLVVASDKPVVVTGATRPASAPGSDGPANIRDAVALAASATARGRSVMVVFDGVIYSPRDIVRMRLVSGREFESANGGSVGAISANGVRFFDTRKPLRPRCLDLPAAAPFPRVEVIYSHVNATPDMARAAVTAGAKGIVLAGTGNGNTSKAVLDALGEAVEAGVVVVRASRVVGGGSVERNIEVDDDRYGFVVSMDLDTAKARILTQLLLANGFSDAAKIQSAFERTADMIAITHSI